MSWTPREIDAGFMCEKCGAPLEDTPSPDWRVDVSPKNGEAYRIEWQRLCGLCIDQIKAQACVDAFKPLVGAARANTAFFELFSSHLPANHRGDDIHTLGQFDCDCFEDLLDEAEAKK